MCSIKDGLLGIVGLVGTVVIMVLIWWLYSFIALRVTRFIYRYITK
jgi:hypothetical protein